MFKRLIETWNDLSEHQRDLCKIGGTVVLLALLGLAGWQYGRPLWHKWQRTQALGQATEFAGRGDYRNAALALQRVFASGTADPATWREATDVLAQIGSPEVLLARQRLAQLSPHDVSVKLALIGDAMRLDRLDVAMGTLAQIDAASLSEAAYFRLAASLAVAMRRGAEAEANLAKLVEIAPTNALARFEYAAVRVWSLDETKRAEGRAELRRLTADPVVRIRAAVELLKDAARQHDERWAIDVMTFLLERFAPGAAPDFASEGLPGWQQLVEGLKTEAGKRADDAALLARWFADIGQAREALVWMDTLPVETSGAPEVAETAAELAARAGDLDRLEKRLREGAWGVWPRDALTLAIASRLQRLRYTDATGRATWQDALNACRDSLVGLRALVRLASAWQDDEGLERALQTVVERKPTTLWAYTALRGIYSSRSDLPKLLQLHERWVRQEPENVELAAVRVILSCVLNRMSGELVKEAEQLREQNAQATEATVALAAVRWRQNKPEEAISLLDELPEEARGQSWPMFWRALALADLSDKGAALVAIEAVAKTRRSPEESELLRAAEAKARKGSAS
jgi:hypothetical protein